MFSKVCSTLLLVSSIPFFFFKNRQAKSIIFHLLLLRYNSFQIVHTLVFCYLLSFSERCLAGSLDSVLPTCAFITVAAYCIGVCCVLVARCLGCWSCRSDKFHVVPGTTVMVEFEWKNRHQGPCNTPPSPFKCEPSRRRVIMEHKTSQVEDTIPGTLRMK